MVNAAKLVIYKDKAGKTRWRLIAGNGESIATSQSYSSRSAAVAAINRVKEIAGKSILTDVVEAKEV